ncbi:hypothetical protein F0562_027152 [Nyssa sinensis]|uniref:DUF4005 domain-containing protein n=1 Tax=Nyssa sinensis TaxID=561372 RepID=A0A5J5B4U1_9ASTE|nr:hypothetical protein F0562_027152 [Nyssa sinensis]
MESEQPKRCLKRFAPEQPETEGKKFVFGSRKASNPAFISAQSKFEELSSTANSARSISSSNQEVGVESNTDADSSSMDNAIRTKEIDLSENAIGLTLEPLNLSRKPKFQKGLAILIAAKNLDVEAKVIAVDSSQAKQKLEKNPSDVRIELDSETGHQAYKSSPEASPRSHMTVPESQGPFQLVKDPPANPNQDSGGRSSLEQLPKDHKSGKRRSSFGSSRPDHVDQEPTDSSSSNSLPNYMQATESARAKAQANSSPRSSPDVQDKDIYIKKRHSLPGANGRQGSPCIQRSMSQAQQGAKGNGTHPNERKWQR